MAKSKIIKPFKKQQLKNARAKQEQLPEYGLGGDVFAGAASGAAAGSALGPWGAAGGAIIGGAVAYFGSKKKQGAEDAAKIAAKKAEEFEQGRQTALANYTPSQSYNPVNFKIGGIVKAGNGLKVSDKAKKQADFNYYIQDVYNRLTPEQKVEISSLQDIVDIGTRLGKAGELMEESPSLYTPVQEADSSAVRSRTELEGEYKIPTEGRSKESDAFGARSFSYINPAVVKRYDTKGNLKESYKVVKDPNTKEGYRKATEGEPLIKFEDGGVFSMYTNKAKKVARNVIQQVVPPRGYSNKLEDVVDVGKVSIGNLLSGEPRKSEGDLREDMWKYALGTSDSLEHFETSPYSPASSKDPNAVYHRAKNIDRQAFLNNAKEYLGSNESIVTKQGLPLSVVNEGFRDVYSDENPDDEKLKFSDAMGRYTIGRGSDDKGNYISYYDKWDLANPIANKVLKRQPEIYDRVYYEEDDLGNYNLIDEFKCGGKVKKPRIMRNGGAQIDTVNPNVEVEGGETLLTPQGDNIAVEGPSHEQGGIPMNLEGGTQVFSDSLKVPGTKKTFSDINKKLIKKIDQYTKDLESSNSTGITRKTAERMLSKLKGEQQDLFVTQERLKIPTKGMRKNDVAKAENGLLVNRVPTYSQLQMPSIQAGLADTSATLATPQGGFPASPALGGGGKGLNMGNGISAAATLAPALYNIGQGLFGDVEIEEPVRYDNFAGQAAAARLRGLKTDVSPQLEEAKQSYRVGRHNLSKAARSRGELLSGLGGLSAMEAQTRAGILSNAQNLDNQYTVQEAQLSSNLGAQQAQMDFQARQAANLANQQARTAQSNMLRTGLSQTSQIVQNNQLMRNQQQRDAMRMESLQSLLPNFTVDPRTGKIIYKG